uniref:Uncharacterized protein n=1 Tax=Ascaris lumbricoides TaxID=6252 RepID=A0A0M3HM28_ASCLU
MIFVFLLLLFIDWITDYERKAEAACNVSFRNEERDVETMQDINKLLIENILPSCVAAKFLNPKRPIDVRLFSKYLFVDEYVNFEGMSCSDFMLLDL